MDARSSHSDAVKTERIVVDIAPGAFARNFWKDTWNYRELFFVLAWRDLAVRYRQAVIGVLWAVVRPFMTMIVFTLIFGRLANLPSEPNVPYPLMVFAGLLVWYLFSTAISEASNSLIGNAHLITKVYFPRIIVPASTIVGALVEMAINFVILLGLMAWYGFMPGWQLAVLPLFVVMAALAAFGPGLYFAAMSAKYRDFRLIIPFILQFGLYLSPVGFSSSIVPERWRLLYSMNPLVGIIDGARWCILGGRSNIDWIGIGIGALVIAAMLWLGLREFRKTESSLIDVI